MVVNPQRDTASYVYDGAGEVRPVEAAGIHVHDGTLTAGGFAYGIFELGRRTER